jgi:hypothetical protein
MREAVKKEDVRMFDLVCGADVTAQKKGLT